MNQEEIQQAAHEEAWVPKADRVKISTTNMRNDPTMTQKEETYQVVLDIIKNTSFYKAFLATADVPEIFMQQFWNTVTKIKESTFYEFKLAKKKCLVDVEVFRQALDICPRVPGKEFIVPPSKEELLTFLIGLRYKGELTHLPQMFIHHMHQPWRTIESIINKCLSRKTASNNKLRQSRVAIIRGMFHKKYIDFAELIWEDFSYQIDNRQLKKSRRKIMPYPKFTKVIINHLLSIHKFAPKALPSGLHTIKDDGVLSRMKFVRVREDIQEYGKAIPNAMLTEDIKQSETYQMFIKYSTGLIPPKKTRVSDESEFEPARRRTGSRRISKKKVSIFANDNIIHEPYVALELPKSMSLTEAAEEEVTRKVHATHERIVTESNPKHARRRPSGIAFKDTSSMSKKISPDPSQKLKGIQTLTADEQLDADTMQALKASKKSSRSHSHIGGSSEGTGFIPGVPDESTVIIATSSEGTEENEYSEEENVDEEIAWVSTGEVEEKKEDDDVDDDKSVDIKETNDEETDDEFVQGNEYVQDDVDKEMEDAGDGRC
ncbi:hypothetical protein Tco_0879688 [Tanacetum coccineum]